MFSILLMDFYESNLTCEANPGKIDLGSS